MAAFVFVFVLQLAVTAPSQDDASFFSLDANGIGSTDYSVTSGNPFRGLLPSPAFYNYDEKVTNIDASLDFYFVPFSDIVVDDPSVVGEDNAYDWGPLERRLDASAAQFRHAILTFSIHIPGQELHLPPYLKDDNFLQLYAVRSQSLGDQSTPDYGDPDLMEAIERFIEVLGRKYDGDRRIGVIHLGLLGFWGEWHTWPENKYIPESSMERVVAGYQAAFKTTKLQARYPYSPAYNANFGLFDASFAYNTLDGPPNGGKEVDWYFWPSVKSAKQTDFWRFAPMAGETRPELQPSVFSESYPAGTFEHQDFDLCVRTSHASFIFHQDAWVTPGYSGDRLEGALRAHTRMGYSFIVDSIVASRTSDDSAIQIQAAVKQVGVAPFYYPLSLVLECDSLEQPLSLGGVDDIIDFGSMKMFQFTKVPSDSSCRSSIKLSLASPHAYDGRPIRFAQRDGVVFVSIPDPSDSGTVLTPTAAPSTAAPVMLEPTTSSSSRPPPSTSDPITTAETTTAAKQCRRACRRDECTSDITHICFCCQESGD